MGHLSEQFIEWKVCSHIFQTAPASSRKKDVEVDTTPIMTNSYTKAQRLKDEKNLKVSFINSAI